MYVRLHAAVLHYHGQLPVLPAYWLCFAMNFDCAAASLAEYCVKCCRPELHIHCSLLGEGRVTMRGPVMKAVFGSGCGTVGVTGLTIGRV